MTDSRVQRAVLHRQQRALDFAKRCSAKLVAGRFNAYSAGSHPKGIINPFALKEVESLGCSTEGLRSKNWEEFAVPKAHRDGFRLYLLR